MGRESPGVLVDVGVTGERIAAIGDLSQAEADQVVNCIGLLVTPGFIDLHNHSDESILDETTRHAECYLTQGCTTLVTGNCGGGHTEVAAFYDKLAEQGWELMWPTSFRRVVSVGMSSGWSVVLLRLTS